MKEWTIAVLPGDGIGPEVTAEAARALEAVAERFGLGLVMSWYAVGAAGVETAGDPLPEETRAAASGADAVLLGAVGDPAFDHAPRHLKPETGLLALRALLGVYANLRPVAIHPALVGRSPVKPDRLRDVDLLIVRELTGGLYYGEPRGKNALQAVNTLAYSVSEIERVARVAFQAARPRRRLVASVDKADVLEGSQLWREARPRRCCCATGWGSHRRRTPWRRPCARCSPEGRAPRTSPRPASRCSARARWEIGSWSLWGVSRRADPSRLRRSGQKQTKLRWRI